MSSATRGASLTLYSGPRDPASHRVRLALAEKALAVEQVDVVPPDLPEDLVHLNPYHSVPTLVDRGLVLYDARVITEYLDERYPVPALQPVDPGARAQSRLIVHRVERDWLAPLTALEGARDRRESERVRRVLAESLLAAVDLFRARAWLLSDEFSLVDCAVAPLLWRLGASGIVLPAPGLPILRYAERAFARPAFQRSLSPWERDLGRVA